MKDYAAEIALAQTRLERNHKEAAEHLLAMPFMDANDALQTIETIEVNLKEMRFYIDRIMVLNRVSGRKAAPTADLTMHPDEKDIWL